ncbi:MAG: DEAD/DEAH box helicase [Thermodesulfobacteriota bacterium]|nr:DEAD/DEAH box helicase [Thermodesulfobacteriota bacterium]
MSFKLLGLKDELVRATEVLGFQSALPIQEKAIPVLLSGEKDFVGLAQTGTGKTGAYGLPLLQLIDPDKSNIQGIVICPTRELCLQLTDDLKQFARYMSKMKIVAIYGGASISTQIKRLKGRPQIIVATPGRLIDMIDRGAANLSQVSYTILDEADEMLNMGFKDDIDRILRTMPDHRKIWLFSATMPQGVAAIARNYLTDPVEVRMGDKHQGPKNIKHICHTVEQKDKYRELKQIIDLSPDIIALVFCRTRRDTQSLSELLMKDGYQAESLHGALSQAKRDSVMRKFRNGSVKILVATDVAARGLDVDDITHVIHYKLPDGAEIYTHRSGRTGRVGKSGLSIVLVGSKEIHTVHAMGKRLNIRFEFIRGPEGKTDFNKTRESRIKSEPAKRKKQAGSWKEPSRFNKLPVRKTDSKKTHEVRADADPVKRKKQAGSGERQRFFINFGRLDKINKGVIVRLICDKSGIGSDMIGEVSLNREFSFFEVEKQAAGIVHDSLNDARLNGRAVEIHKVVQRNAA